jgi:hypothetical protein
MPDAQLLNLIERLESQDSTTVNIVAAEQATAMDYYLGKPFGTEEEGRSAVVSSDVYDVVEGLTPNVLKPFVSSDDIVRFAPEGPDDEEASEQESDYINFVVTQKNDVFETLVQWVKTGLLQKNGVVKYWWDTSKRSSIERYDGLSDDEYALLLDEESVTVIEHTERPGEPTMAPDPQTGQPVQMPGEPTHDVVLRVSQAHGEPRYCVVPPEEIRINRNATSPDPKKARFFQHRTMRTLSELREMGYDVADDIADGYEEKPQTAPQFIARHQANDIATSRGEDNDPSLREVLYRESYLYADVDGDGMAELRKVCAVGRVVLANEETEEIPFCGWTPSVQPFKYDGRCPADETTEIQLIKSTVLRQTMDNIYTLNNNTRYVSEKVNLDDLLDNQIAGIVRVQGDVVSNHVMPGPVTPIGAITMPMVEYFDSAKENRTGFTRYNQGTDANSLNKTATGVRIISEAGNERVGLVSRCFAEMGLKPLMLGVHGLCRRHSTKKETIKLRGKWVEVDPRSWKTRYDMSVSVGLGSADKQMQLQGAQLLMDKQLALIQAGAANVVTPANVYEAGSLLTKGLGEKNGDKYFTRPPDQPPAPPDPTQDPAFKFQVADLHLRGRETDIKERELAIKDRDSKTAADAKAAEIALKAELQGHDMTLQLMQAVQAIQQQLHDMQASHADLVMRAQGQQHAQGLAESQQALAAQGQEHEQGMAEQMAETTGEPADGQT